MVLGGGESHIPLHYLFIVLFKIFVHMLSSISLVEIKVVFMLRKEHNFLLLEL